MKRSLGIAAIALGISALFAAVVLVGSLGSDNPFERLGTDTVDAVTGSVENGARFLSAANNLLAIEGPTLNPTPILPGDFRNPCPPGDFDCVAADGGAPSSNVNTEGEGTANGGEEGSGGDAAAGGQDTGGEGGGETIGGGNFFFPDPEEGFVPCGKRGGIDPGTGKQIVIGTPCNICHVGEMSQNIINFLIRTVVPLLAAILIGWGGFEMITSGGSEERYKAGRGRITQAIIGVAIVLLAWALVNFFLSQFFKGDTTGKWYSFDCTVEQGGPVEQIQPKDPPVRAVIPPGGIPSGLAGEPITDSEAKFLLLEEGIEIKTGAEFAGTRINLINELILLKRSCECRVRATAGTNNLHFTGTYSHINGFKVDISSKTSSGAASLTAYIKSRFLPNGTRNDGAQLWVNPNTGAVYALENIGEDNEHWDILLK